MKAPAATCAKCGHPTGAAAVGRDPGKVARTLGSRQFWIALVASLTTGAPILNHAEPATVGNILFALIPLLAWGGGLSAADVAAAYGAARRESTVDVHLDAG